MKKPFPLYTALLLFSTIFVFFSSCKKINEATLLGGGLVPEVDNINTFDTILDAQTNNRLLEDTGKLAYADPVALGTITADPEFGQTTASVYFQLLPPAYGRSPFTGTNPVVDSVILSLDFVGSYGDVNTPQTVHVYEMANTDRFHDSTYYTFYEEDFEFKGGELGRAELVMSRMKDTITVVETDTVKVANQLRIHLDKAFGQQLASYDSATVYRNDTLYKNALRGLALTTDAGIGNGLAYFSLSNTAKTRLTVYYKAANDTATKTVVFTHALRSNGATGGQANLIKRQPGGGWAASLGDDSSTKDETLYIQSAPGSAAYITIPKLDSFDNKLIHRAELIVTRIPSMLDNIFTPPTQLFVDRITTANGKDSAFVFPEFLIITNGVPQYNFASAGGKLLADGTYRFNITKVVQDVLTGNLANPTLRLYAPFDTRPLNPALSPASPVFAQAIPYPAYGRVVLAGGNYSNQDNRLRLRIVYSNL